MKKNNCKLGALYQKLQNKEFNFTKNLKQIFLSTLTVFLIALVVFAFVGFNTSLSYSKGYSVTVNFNTQINNQEREIYTKEIVKELKNNKINNYELTQVGDSYDSAIVINVKKVSQKQSEKVVNQLNKIISNLETKLSENYELPFLKISEPVAFKSALTLKQFGSYVLAFSLVLVAISVYMFIRFDISSMLSNLIVNANNIVLLLSLIVIFRIPISSFVFVSILLTILFTSYLSAIHFERIKVGYDKEQFNDLTNNQIADIMVKKLLKPTIIMFISVFVLSCAILGISLPFALEIAGELLISTFLCLASSIFFTTWVWAYLFNKDKDTRFKVRQLKKNQPKKKEEDNIVV